MGPAPADRLVDPWQLLQQVLEVLPIAVIAQRGPDLVYEVVNPRAEAMMPARGGLLGRTIQDVHPEIDDLPSTIWGRALAGETVVERGLPDAFSQAAGTETRGRFHDLTLTPIFLEGAVAGVLTIFSEATEGPGVRRTELERQLQHEHEVVKVLQHALLPRRLPDVPGWLLAATYEPAGREGVVGGDFYDVLTWRGETLLVLGDVSGKGSVAASVTAEVRGALRVLAAQGLDLVDMLRWVDRMLVVNGEDFCTVAVATLATAPAGDRGSARVLLAGHPPALWLRGDGARGALVGTPTPPLGTGLPIAPAIAEVDLADGDTLLLYSDGLLEAHAPDRTVDPMDLPDLLARVGTLELGDGLVSVCSELVGGPGQGRDDLAILAARRKAVV